jgi:hypothetical protein
VVRDFFRYSSKLKIVAPGFRCAVTSTERREYAAVECVDFTLVLTMIHAISEQALSEVCAIYDREVICKALPWVVAVDLYRAVELLGTRGQRSLFLDWRNRAEKVDLIPAFKVAIADVVMCRDGASLRGLVARLPAGPLSAYSESLCAAIEESCDRAVGAGATWKSLYTDFLLTTAVLIEGKKEVHQPGRVVSAKTVLKPTSGDVDSPRKAIVRDLFKTQFVAGLVLSSIGETQPGSRERMAADAIRETLRADVVENGFRKYELRREVSVYATRFQSGSHRRMCAEVSEVLEQAGYVVERVPGLELGEERSLTVMKAGVTHTFRFAPNANESSNLGMEVIFDLAAGEKVPARGAPASWADSFGEPPCAVTGPANASGKDAGPNESAAREAEKAAPKERERMDGDRKRAGPKKAEHAELREEEVPREGSARRVAPRRAARRDAQPREWAAAEEREVKMSARKEASPVEATPTVAEPKGEEGPKEASVPSRAAEPKAESEAKVRDGAFAKGATGTAGQARTREPRVPAQKAGGVDLSKALTRGAIAMVWADGPTGRAAGAVTGLSSGIFLALKEALQLLVNAGLAGGPEALVVFNTEVAGGLKEILRTLTRKATMSNGKPLPVEIEREVLALKSLLTAGGDLSWRNVLFGLFFDQAPAPVLPELSDVLCVLDRQLDPAVIREAVPYVLGAIEALPDDSASGRLVCLSRDVELRVEFARDFFEIDAVRRIAAPVAVTPANLAMATRKYEKHLDATALQLKYFLLERDAVRAKLLGYVDADLWAKAFAFVGDRRQLSELSRAIAEAQEAVAGEPVAADLVAFTLSFAFDGLDDQVEQMKEGLRSVVAAVS